MCCMNQRESPLDCDNLLMFPTTKTNLHKWQQPIYSIFLKDVTALGLHKYRRQQGNKSDIGWKACKIILEIQISRKSFLTHLIMIGARHLMYP